MLSVARCVRVVPSRIGVNPSHVLSKSIDVGVTISTVTCPGSPAALTANVAYPGPTRVYPSERIGSPGIV